MCSGFSLLADTLLNVLRLSARSGTSLAFAREGIRAYTNPHNNSEYRVNGVFFNIPEFYDAFPEIRPDDALYRNVSMRPVIG